MIDWAALAAWFATIPVALLLVAAFLSSFAEGVPVLGAPFPGNTVVMVIVAQAVALDRAIWPIWVAFFLGGLAADVLFYYVGRRFGLGFLVRATARLPKLMRFGPERQGELERLLDRHAFKTVFISRISPGLRNLFSYTAGAARLPLGRFLGGVVPGGLLVSVFFVGLGILAGYGLEQIGRIAGRTLTIAAIAAATLLVVGYLLTRRLRLFAPRSLALLYTAALTFPLFVYLAADHVRRGDLRIWEESGGQALVADALSPLALFAPVAHPGLAMVLLIGLAFVLGRAGRWRQAMGILGTTLGLAGIVSLARFALHRHPPSGEPGFPLADGFPDMAAPLLILFGVFLVNTWPRVPSKLSRGARNGAVWTVIGVALLGHAATQWPSDVAAGASLGAAVAASGLLADTFVQRLLRGHGPDTDLGHRVVACMRRTGERSLSALQTWLAHPATAWSLVGIGVLARLVAPWTWALGPDATRYAAMGLGLVRHGAFWMEWGDVYTPGAAGASHHFPPLYPMILSGFYKVLGFSETSTRIASIVLALAALVVVYVCTRDLYGRVAARIATAVTAISPVLVQTTAKGYSENLVLLLFVLAMWGILKSLEKPWFIVAGGLFAGLAYLTKSSMGIFFVVAGLGGLGWRLYWKGWKVLREGPYLVAIAVFGGLVAAWALRNLRLFGDWQTSTHLASAYAAAIHDPAGWAALLPWSIAVMFGLGYLLFMGVLPWLPTLARIPRLANEHDSGLWLSFTLPVLLTVLIDAALWHYEEEFYLHNVRYVSFALVPIVWLLLRHVSWNRKTVVAVVASGVILLSGTVYYGAIPNVPVAAEASDELGRLMTEGTTLAFVDTNDVYRTYFDVTQDGTKEVAVRTYFGADVANVTEEWALARGEPDMPLGYERQATVGGPRDMYTIWRRG